VSRKLTPKLTVQMARGAFGALDAAVRSSPCAGSLLAPLERLEWILFGKSRSDAERDATAATSSVHLAGEGSIWLVISDYEKDDETGLPLYWSNAGGWVSMSEAERFTTEEMVRMSLPSRSRWYRFR